MRFTFLLFLLGCNTVDLDCSVQLCATAKLGDVPVFQFDDPEDELVVIAIVDEGVTYFGEEGILCVDAEDYFDDRVDLLGPTVGREFQPLEDELVCAMDRATLESLN